MLTAIIIGASSGIGREIAVQLCARGFRIGIAARNQNGLKDLSRILGPENCVIRGFDVSHVASALEGFHQLRDELGEIHFVYLVAGIGLPNPDLQWALESDFGRELFGVCSIGYSVGSDILQARLWSFGSRNLGCRCKAVRRRSGIRSIEGIRVELYQSVAILDSKQTTADLRHGSATGFR
jgi:hypothetical protein